MHFEAKPLIERNHFLARIAPEKISVLCLEVFDREFQEFRPGALPFESRMRGHSA